MQGHYNNGKKKKKKKRSRFLVFWDVIVCCWISGSQHLQDLGTFILKGSRPDFEHLKVR
jgi:hypothetical protein